MEYVEVLTYLIVAEHSIQDYTVYVWSRDSCVHAHPSLSVHIVTVLFVVMN